MNDKSKNIFNTIWGMVAGATVTEEAPTTTTTKKKSSKLPFYIAGAGLLVVLFLFLKK